MVGAVEVGGFVPIYWWWWVGFCQFGGGCLDLLGCKIWRLKFHFTLKKRMFQKKSINLSPNLAIIYIYYLVMFIKLAFLHLKYTSYAFMVMKTSTF